MSTTWILVAHRSGARIFEQARTHAGLRLVATIEHPAGRLREGEIKADRPGRVNDRFGAHRHGLARGESSVEHYAAEFARELAEELREARLGKRYDRLLLVAGPKLLGKVREALDRDTATLVEGSLSRDLQDIAERDLPSHLAGVLSFAGVH